MEQAVGRSLLAGRKICLVAPYPPRKGGVTVQTDLLARALVRDGAVLLKVDTNLQKLRFPIIGTPIRLAVQPWVVAFRLLRVLRKCEIVHVQAAANWGFMPAWVAVPLARLFGKRVVLGFHSGIGPAFMDRFGWLVKTPFRIASASFVVSRELQDAFAERGVRTVIVRNLFESETFKFRERAQVEPKIVWTRSFEPLYDPMSAVKAFEIVRKQCPNAEFTMAGDGPLLAKVREYVETHGIAGLKLVGRLGREEVARLMDEASICLNTSRHDGLPTALLEAGACGLAIVTTKAGGIPSLFENGTSALMVDVGDYEAMAENIIGLVRDAGKARSLGAAARDAVKDYSWERASEVLAEVYGFESN